MPRTSIDIDGKPVVVETHGRHDPCVGIRAAPIAEAALAIVLMDHALRQRALGGDVEVATPRVPAKIVSAAECKDPSRSYRGHAGLGLIQARPGVAAGNGFMRAATASLRMSSLSRRSSSDRFPG